MLFVVLNNECRDLDSFFSVTKLFPSRVPKELLGHRAGTQFILKPLINDFGTDEKNAAQDICRRPTVHRSGLGEKCDVRGVIFLFAPVGWVASTDAKRVADVKHYNKNRVT